MMIGMPCPTAHRTYLVAAVICGVASSGCLSQTYTIAPGELQRLRNVPAEERAARVHVVQRFSTTRVPPPAPPLQVKELPPPPSQSTRGAAPGAVPVYDYYPNFGRPAWTPWRPIVLMRRRAEGGAGAPETIAPISGPDGGVIETGDGGLGSLLSNTSVDDSKAAAVLFVVAGVGLGVALAATEGARYDGFVALHPDHPVHLMGPRGRYRLIKLSQLNEAAPMPNEEAVIHRHEGIGMWELGRAPLNRRGLTYGMDFGQRTVPTGGGRLMSASLADFTLGMFLSERFGILLGTALAFGEENGADLFALAPRIEAQWYPIALGPLHFGVFGGFSVEDVDVEQFVDGAQTVQTLSSPVGEVGAVCQIELTTRLALNLRWGLSNWLAAHEGDAPQRLTIGMSVY